MIFPLLIQHILILIVSFLYLFLFAWEFGWQVNLFIYVLIFVQLLKCIAGNVTAKHLIQPSSFQQFAKFSYSNMKHTKNMDMFTSWIVHS